MKKKNLIIFAIKKRQSWRSFEPKIVSRRLVDQILDAARFAPTSCNLQLTEVLVIDDQSLIKNLSKTVSRKFAVAKTFLLLLYDRRFTIKRHSAVTSLGAFMQNVLLVAESLGLTAYPAVGFENDDKLRQALSIPSTLEIAALISLGYPKNPTKKDRPRLPLNSIRYWNRWEGKSLKDSLNLDDWAREEIADYRARIAPTYLYNTYFHLNVFESGVYEAIFNRLIQEYGSAIKTRVLDFISYDCSFAKLLVEKIKTPTLTVSDFIDYPLKIFQKAYPVTKNLLLPPEESSSKFDLITCVHKLEFSPQYENLLKLMVSLLAPGGQIFLTSSMEPLSLKFHRAFQLLKRRVKGETVNVYEHNPFYKIGPYKPRSLGEIKAVGKSLGLKIKNSGVEKVSLSRSRLKHPYFWIIFAKS